MSAANVFNLGADIGAMGASLALIVPANINVLTVTFGIISLIAVLFIPYSTYAKYLKWLTLPFLVRWRRFPGAYFVAFGAACDVDSSCGAE
jgi:hypothetical protein